MDGTFSCHDDNGDGLGEGGGYDDEMDGIDDGDGVDESSTVVSKFMQ